MDCKYVLKVKISLREYPDGHEGYDAQSLCDRLRKMGITRFRIRFPHIERTCKYDGDKLIVPIYFESRKDMLTCKMISE